MQRIGKKPSGPTALVIPGVLFSRVQGIIAFQYFVWSHRIYEARIWNVCK